MSQGTAPNPQHRTARNPVVPPGAREPSDVVTPELLARLTRDLPGGATTISTRCPFTGGPLAELPEATPADVAAAFSRARSAAGNAGWAARPVRARAAVLLRFHDLLMRRQDEILDLIQVETGKTRAHAHEEIQAVAVAARHYGRRAAGYLRPHRRAGALPVLTRVVQAYRPHGVVGQVAPWNYPLELSVGDALPALAAGNGLVTKPATQTALTALWAHQLLVEAGLPADLWQIVIGKGQVVGRAVVDGADYVSFTGSTGTGREIAARAAGRLVGASLELGGKNPMLVLRDADVDRAAEGAVRACFSSAGQLCVAIERIYVDEAVADPFLDQFLARTRALRLGRTLGYGPDVGSLASRRQLETVARHVDEARDNGASVLAGGQHRPDVGPLFYEPTVLAGVEPGMAVYAEETFGPVVSVYRVTGEDEAVERANDTGYGLNSSVWTANSRRGRDVAARLRTGTVNINEGYAAAYGSPAAPMGGMGDSGIGRRHGRAGIVKYTETQTIAAQHLVPLAPSFGLSDERYARLMTAGLRVMKTLHLP